MDTAQSVAESMYDEFKEPLYAPPPLLRRMVAAGTLGRKTGQGFHAYAARAADHRLTGTLRESSRGPSRTTVAVPQQPQGELRVLLGDLFWSRRSGSLEPLRQ